MKQKNDVFFMEKVRSFLLSFLSLIIPGLKKTTAAFNPKYEYKKLQRNAKCYCNSNKKYKHCHLEIDNSQGRIAVVYTNEYGKQEYDIFNKKKYKTITESHSSFPLADYADAGDFGGGDGFADGGSD